MILLDFFLRKINHCDMDTMREEVSKLARQKLERTQAAQKNQQFPGYAPQNYYVNHHKIAELEQMKARKVHPAGTTYPLVPEKYTLSREEREKIVRNGKSWKERNLQVLEETREEPFKPFSKYHVALVDSTGSDLRIPRQEWNIESNTVLPITMVFDIPANTTIVGLLVTDSKGHIVKSKKLNIEPYPIACVFTLNLRIE